MDRVVKSFEGLRRTLKRNSTATVTSPPNEVCELQRSQYSLVSCGELTPGALHVWSELPELVKYDSDLATFRERYESCNDPEGQQGVEDPAKKAHHHGDIPHPPNCAVLRLCGDDVTSEKLSQIETFKNYSLNQDTDDETISHPSPSTSNHSPKNKTHTTLTKTLYWMKMTSLLCVWLLFTGVFVLHGEKEDDKSLLTIVPIRITDVAMDASLDKSKVTVLLTLEGPFLSYQTDEYRNKSESHKVLEVWLETWNKEHNETHEDSLELKIWSIGLASFNGTNSRKTEKRIKRLSIDPVKDDEGPHKLRIRMSTTSNDTVPVLMHYRVNPIDENTGLYCSLVLLIALYVLIIFEIINRTLAAVIASSCALAMLAVVGERPNLSELVSWLDMETLILLFSMMLLVAITADTGLFDYLAVFTFSVTKGRMWPLINLLCFFTATVSTFLDNVTTVLLMTPVTIRLCEMMELNPVPILISMVIYCNIGGTATPVGDPPNVIIASNPDVINANIHFANFTGHMALGILVVSVQIYFQLRFMYRDPKTLRPQVPKDIQELKQQIGVWRRVADSIGAHSQDEATVKNALMRKVGKMERRLAELVRERKKKVVSDDKFHSMLCCLKDKYKIRDRVLLYKSAAAIIFVVAAFFLHALPEFRRISLGWTALMGAILLLILVDRDDITSILARVEWSTLLFFAALFVLMEALSKLGLIQWIGGLVESMILQVNEESRLAVAIVLIIWVSGIVSAFVDNIPLTTMMVRVATSLGKNPALGLPMAPLIWALSFGVCLGGNGTLIGASANVVTAGVAEQHGYRFSFLEFFKIGFPVMLGSLATATGYLLLCHCVFSWH